MEQTDFSKISQGDSDAWRLLLKQAIPLIYRMFVSRWPNPSLAEELTQKTIFDAVKSAKTYDSQKGSPYTWLLAIARNNLAYEARSRAARKTIDEDLTGWLEIIDRQPLPDEVLEKSQTADTVRQALNSLDEKSRDVLKAKYLDDLSAGKIAGKLKLTEKAVHSLLYRARNALRDKLIKLNPHIEEQSK
ncbi:MAG: RNA polymerase sigma factor [Planctomycetaceae bacterium]|nr:RNA polymerase sigma factor [Planctomycetaceae bacterium]